ncbi:MAG: 50S ribosomal protein L13 [Methanosarcinaceae archaeon]|mgnify:CR=1 FL=1|nr:50S ribosomal protein L13 [Methanosarcinaceae archaeon]
MIIIDANGLIMGRLASVVATRLLNGENIHIINVEKAVVSGKRASVLGEYRETIERGSTENGPYFPKRPERIMKRTVRGMLPHKKKTGRDALAKLKVHVGVPEQFKGKKTETVEAASMTRLSSKRFVTLGEISERLGAKL